MIEILFRGKATSGLNGGKWIYGFYVNGFWHGSKNEHGILPTFDGGGYCEVYQESVGRFTSLPDKNGTKIFEGDIVKDRYEDLYIVKYGRHDLYCCGCCFQSHESVGYYLSGVKDDSPLSDEDAWKNIEVIGNIHDNPELLEV